MKFTVITVCLNSVDTIEKTIKSVIEQDYIEKEYIIVDGGSTDGTLDIIKKYDKYITNWVSEPDQGIFDAMNKGVGMATGDVIAFLNSDDWYMDSSLSMIYDAFMIKDCDCVCCDNYVIEKDGSRVYYDASNLCVDDMYKRMIYFHSAIFARKEMFKKSNNFDLSYKLAADYDWMLRIIIKGARLFYLHRPVFTFCHGGVSTINEIECAREAREIAIRYLPENKKSYLVDINDRYYEIAACVIGKECVGKKVKAIIRNNNPIILWGAGRRGEQCLKWLRAADIQVQAIIDGDKDKWGSTIDQVKIYSSQFLQGKECNVIITPDKNREEIQNEIKMLQGSFCVFVLKDLWRIMVEMNL